MTTVIVGGTYFERCLCPELNQLYGSGGRAAAALSGESDVELHTYVCPANRNDVERLCNRFNIKLVAHQSDQAVAFRYVHGLRPPTVSPHPLALRAASPIEAQGETLLVFGMLEGHSKVTGKSVVYDPQSEAMPVGFRARGSRAERLAVVMNESEAIALGNSTDLKAAIQAVREAEGAELIIAKRGAAGALGNDASGWFEIPAYWTESVMPIGSGDIFSAAVTLYWGQKGYPARDAADLASRTVADYVASRRLPLLPEREAKSNFSETVSVVPGTVYLAAPFFNFQQRWMLEEARVALAASGLRVFSPLHDVGRGPPSAVAPADLRGLEESDRVFALVDDSDPGTLFEIGYARARSTPVFAYGEAVPEQDLTMMVGSGCLVIRDFVTAIHRTIWKR